MRLLVLLAASSLLAAPVAPAAVPARSFTIREPMGLDWSNELVHVDLAFEPGVLDGAPQARVTAPDGKTIASQVSDAVRHGDGRSIRSMRVWFMADVAANQEARYRIEPGAAGPAQPGVSAADNGAAITLSTATAGGRIGIRLPAGRREFAWPAPASTVPGPVQALLLPSGRETGTSRWEVPFLVKSVESTFTATGPLFAEARIAYTFDTGYWVFRAKVIRDCPMIVIEEELDNGDSGLEAAAFDRFHTLRLNGSGFKPAQAFFTGRSDQPRLSTLLSNAVPAAWTAQGRLPPNWFASPVNGFTPSFDRDRVDFHLTGYPSVIPRIGCLARLVDPGRDAIGFAALNAGSWKNPMSLRFAETASGEFLVRLPLQAYKSEWAIDGFGRGSPNYTGRTLYAPPTRSRRAYGIMLSPAEDEATANLGTLFAMGSRLGAYPLDTVKDWTVEWPDPLANGPWAEEPTAAATNALLLLRDKMAFFRALGHYAQFSMGFHYHFARSQYPVLQAAITNPAAITAAERRELRRLCAVVANDMHTVDRFPWGTGFHLNNPNMSMMAMEARVKSALLVKDHPNFMPWGEWTAEFVRDYNRRFILDSGATYENPHYTLGVTFSDLLDVNRVLVEAGLPDALDTPLFHRATRFIMDWLTPPDPRFLGHRVILPLGNCSYQSVPPAMARLLVDYYRTRDPERAGQLQWFANQTLPTNQQVRLVEDRVPALGSVHYPGYGASFRHGFGTPHESLFLLFAGTCDGHYEWESDQMTYTFYGKGQPVSLHFGNGYMPIFARPWLRNRVSFDRMFEVSERNITRVEAASLSPGADYARAMRQVDRLRPLRGEFPFLEKGKWTAEESANWSADAVTNVTDIPPTVWHRQALFLKDPDPSGPNYIVLRDSFGGTPTRPTEASFWFLANAMSRTGDVFRFDGQCGADIDVFVHTPAGAAVETNRYGHAQTPYGRLVGFDPVFHPDGKLQETQLLLRLRQPPGQGYLVVLYPRLKGVDPEAACTRLGEHAVKVVTPASTDYAFLNAFPFSFSDERVGFKGLAASVRFHKDGRIVVANHEGQASVTVGGKTIRGDGPFVVTLQNGRVTPDQGSPVEVRDADQ